MHLAAGLAALALGTAVLTGRAHRVRARLFGLLCAALALWNLGIVLDDHAPWSLLDRPQIFLLGSCAAAPLGLHFAARLTGLGAPAARLLLPAAYLLAGLLWLSSWTPLYRSESHSGWNLVALVVLGLVLALALGLLLRHHLGLPRGPERAAFRVLLAGGLLAVAGGLSDFLPRPPLSLPRLGPFFLLVFLVVVSAMVVRHRFLDLHHYLARALALLAGAALVALLLFVVVWVAGPGFLPLFLASLLVLAVAGPVGSLLLGRARSLLEARDPVARGLLEVSEGLTRAESREEVREAVEEAVRALPGEVTFVAFFSPEADEPFRVTYVSRAGTSRAGLRPDPMPRGSAIERLLDADRAPLTRSFLREEAAEGPGPRGRAAAAAQAWMEGAGLELVVPLLSRERLAGWLAVGGGRSEGYLTSEAAAGLMAVGHQAVASMERVEALEEARRGQSLAALGEMAAGLAHEVRNPVGAIRGAAQVLALEREPARSAEMIEVIEQETGRLGRVVGEFLDYARPAEPRRESVDLEALTRECLRNAEAGGRGLDAELSVATGTPAALGDRDQLQRALDNLIRNAREAAGEEGSLRIELRPARDGQVALRLEDDGPGIEPDELSRLFRPFHTTKAGGTGLGLALVHRVVEAHGGTIRAEGRPGLGAAFTLFLPAAEERS
jgi:signal transduction histidine kinase